VTGAGGGIGLSIVQGLLADEMVKLVVGIDLITKELERLQIQAGERLEIVVGDVSERGVNQKAVNIAIKHTGRLDSIILNAGILQPVGRVATIDIEEWRRLIDVNFISLLHAVCMSTIFCKESADLFRFKLLCHIFVKIAAMS
jgi:NADP-dependent 3-hydroxy acid dehydrogenase YdfG